MSIATEGHAVFNNDPVYYHSLLHCRVCVSTKVGKEHVGWVHTIDPVSESVLLVEFEDKCSDGGGKKAVTLVSGYNITNITLLERDPPQDMVQAIDNICKKEQVSYSKKEVTVRREALCVWLAENRVPYTVNDDMSIQVLHAATIRQPYTAESVQCTNEVVLDKVMKLVQQLPTSP